MRGDRRKGFLSPHLGTLRQLSVLVGLVSLVFAYVGLRREMGPNARDLDLIYYSLQMLVLETPPLPPGGPTEPLLHIARFTLPAVTFYAFMEAGRLIFAAEMRRLKARRSSDHTIICGEGLLALGLSHHLRAAGHRVVHIWSGGAEWPDPSISEPLRVLGDARDPDVLRAAGLARAAALYVCTEDSATNTAIALASSRAMRDHWVPSIYAHIGDPELCLALQARHLGASIHASVRLDFFNIDDLAARRLFAEEPLVRFGGPVPRVLVIGATAFGRAVIVELARQWRMHAVSDDQLELSVVDMDAGRAVDDLCYRYPFLRQVCAITPYDSLAVALDAASPCPLDRVFVCFDDEQHALKIALTTSALWRGGAGSVLIRQEQLTALQGAFDSARGDRLLDEVSGTLRLFGVVDAACEPDLIRDDLEERLARAIHEGYVLARRRHTRQGSVAVTWHQLPERLRRENRAQAHDIGRKLRSIGCVLSPRIEPDDEHVFTESDVEQLAEMEHGRWLDERTRAGWRPGEDRDDGRKVHPAVRPWNELPDWLRTINYDMVRELPAILADAGFRIVRIEPAPTG